MTAITIYADASYRNGAAGYAALLLTFKPDGKVQRVKVEKLAGYRDDSTSAEFFAVLIGLRAIKAKQAQIDIYSDSQSVIRLMTDNRDNSKYQHLINEIRQLCAEHQVNWHWCKAHSGNSYNERVNFEARKALSRFITAMGLETDDDLDD